MTAAQIKALELSQKTGKPYAIKNYRHNSLQWKMFQSMVARGWLTEQLAITAKGRKALTANG